MGHNVPVNWPSHHLLITQRFPKVLLGPRVPPRTHLQPSWGLHVLSFLLMTGQGFPRRAHSWDLSDRGLDGLRGPQREVSLPVPRVSGPLYHRGLSWLVGTSVPCEVVFLRFLHCEVILYFQRGVFYYWCFP